LKIYFTLFTNILFQAKIKNHDFIQFLLWETYCMVDVLNFKLMNYKACPNIKVLVFKENAFFPILTALKCSVTLFLHLVIWADLIGPLVYVRLALVMAVSLLDTITSFLNYGHCEMLHYSLLESRGKMTEVRGCLRESKKWTVCLQKMWGSGVKNFQKVKR